MNSGPSILEGVTRRASLILAGRHPSLSRRSRNGLGSHCALNSRDSVDGVPLSDIEHSPRPIAHSSTPSFGDNRSSIGDTVDPFIHPSEARVSLSSPHSPFADSKQPADIPKSNSPPTVDSSNGRNGVTRERHRLLPGTPPMSISVTYSGGPSSPPNQKALQPTPPPVINSSVSQPAEERKAVRWWHEWLCGCGEGPDRGGDHQVRAHFGLDTSIVTYP